MDAAANKYCQKIEDLYKQHASKMTQVAYRRVGDTRLAEEMTQEVFVVACCKPAEVFRYNPAGWLYNSLNKIIMREMARTYHKAEVGEDAGDTPGELDLDLPMDLYLPRGLTEREQDLILSRLDRELSYREIGEKFGLSEVASRQAVSRAIKKCRGLMEKSSKK